jgi:glycosyltransferase involved in cell wall biosynthesis
MPPQQTAGLRVAIVTDWLNSFGGAERVLMELHRLFPEAPLYTSVHDARGLPAGFAEWDVRTSFLQRIPFARRRHRWLLPLMPLAFESLDLRGYDLVISSSSACAKGVIVDPGATHLCYCHTPCRYIWDLYHEYVGGSTRAILAAPVAHWLRMWDCASSDRVDHFVANSRFVADRIQRHYRRPAEVIHPPVDVDRFRLHLGPTDGYYLVVSRLVSYKRIDLAVAAATRMNRKLLIVGEGPEEKRLRAMAGPSVRFLGWQDDDAVTRLYEGARAVLFPGLEDFGIVPVEAQAAGRPVIAYGRGGATETVADGVTGVHFDRQTPEALIAAIEGFERERFDPVRCRRNAERFSAETFRDRIQEAIGRALVAPALEPLGNIPGRLRESA